MGDATQTSEQIRKHLQNRHAVLRSLHFDGAQKRVDLSRRCGIRKSSVTKITSELLDLGLVSLVDPKSDRSPLQLDPSRTCVLAAAISGSAMRSARVYLDGRHEDFASVSLKDTSDPERVVGKLAERLRQLRPGPRTKVLGHGVAVAGLADPGAGRVVYSASLGQWRDVPLGEMLSRRLKGRVRVDNNVRCQLWAAAWFGRLLASNHSLMYVGILRGVASSAVIGGARVLGGHFAAGEIGHVRAGDESRLCQCGRMDCLETYSGGAAIAAEINRIRPQLSVATASDIAKAAAEDRAIVNVLDRAMARLARAISGTIASLDPDVLVIGSADRALSEILRPHLQRHIDTELMGFDAREATITIGDAADATSISGIAGMVVEDCFAAGGEF